MNRLAKAHALIRQREELAAAEVLASGAEAMIAHMKLMIAKLRATVRAVLRARSQGARQLELQLEELEAETSENTAAGEKAAAGV